MQHDDVVWMVIGQGFCSFKSRIQTSDFCRNPYNMTGLCNKSSCPLANSRYATIREEDGMCYLYIKTPERMHQPDKWWEKIKLSPSYAQALKEIDKQLEHWPKYMIHRNKQRLTKIHQYLIRMRKLRTRVRPKLVRVHKKVEQREARREQKALAAAQLEKSIEGELLERLQRGTYGDIYNFPEREYSAVLDENEAEANLESEEEEEEGEFEFVEGEEDDEEGEEEELEEWEKELEAQLRSEGLDKVGLPKGAAAGAAGGGGGPRVEIEYEEEQEREVERAGASW